MHVGWVIVFILVDMGYFMSHPAGYPVEYPDGYQMVQLMAAPRIQQSAFWILDLGSRVQDPELWQRFSANVKLHLAMWADTLDN